MQQFGVRGLFLAVALTLDTALMSVAFAASPAPAEGENGMVVTAQHLASQIGVDILKNGGNAVDAAVAVGYALAVVYPTAGNLGGGGFMTIRLKDGKTTFLDFRERAPLASTKTMYLDKDGNPIPGASTDGYLAVGVPGSVAGFEMAREKYGSKSRQDLLAPAIKLAKEGFVLEQGDVASFADGNDMLAQDPAASKIFLKDGKPLELGATLAAGRSCQVTYRAISEQWRRRFLQGRNSRSDRQGQRRQRWHSGKARLRAIRGA